ncbi:Ricin-type beta-trefoil lectin domain-containing protein [Micromonospora matsumotoense]|uniref:Ricin-type beta-trefoil lectin domain-containing protein n=1 Tax=Micromonospora matsumotoense TaxID=121616 RepID=A0A1C4XQ33_9ACTN|nr:ricin-type beta-trefoil lectin domain protein [Micromonospora matsumotoense]SCF10563.1 Ricin-type beta-trefoil lectin domain-containing protein [Micromonospora matsumotoense]
MFPKQTGVRSGAAPLSRPLPLLVLLLLLALVAAVGTVLLPTVSEAVTRSSQTMYTPPSGTPAPGTLYPRGIRLEHSGSSNGTMLATFEQYTNGKPVFPIYRSTDTGNSWTKISEVADTQNGWGMRWQPQLFELPTAIGNFPAGTILAAGDSVPSNRSGFKIDMYASTNQGQTWTFVKNIVNGAGRPVWEPFFLVNGNKLIVYYSDERDSSHSQKLVHQVSTDGVNWGPVVDDVATSTRSDRPGMSTVAKLPNGNYVMTYEYGGSPAGNLAVYYKISANPEAFGSVTGQVLRSTDGHTALWNPYITWLPTGGSNGTLVVSAQSTTDVFVNTQGGAANAWTRVDSKVAGGYSRGMVPLADGHSLVVLSGGYNGSTVNSVTYSTIDLGGVVPTTPVPSTGTTTARLIGAQSGRCLDVPNSNPANGTRPALWDCHTGANQQWTYNASTRQLQSLGKCLGVSGQSTTPGATAVLGDCGSGAHQQWTLTNNTVVGVQSGLCLDVANNATANGSAVNMWTCNGGANQRWTRG